MSVAFQGLFAPMPLRSIEGTALANPALFYEIGDPLERPARIIKIDNLTDRNVLISFNQGVVPFTIVPANGFVLLDLTTNSTIQGSDYLCAEGAQFWAKTATTTPTMGSVFLTAIGSKDY